MGWGCYKHEWDAGSDHWNEALAKLCNRKMKEKPRTFGRDEQICPACYVELEDKAKSLESQVKTLTAERDAQAEAVRKLGRVAAWMKLNMADPRIASLCLQRHIDGVEKLVPFAEALNTDWIDMMNNPIALAMMKEAQV